MGLTAAAPSQVSVKVKCINTCKGSYSRMVSTHILSMPESHTVSRMNPQNSGPWGALLLGDRKDCEHRKGGRGEGQPPQTASLPTSPLPSEMGEDTPIWVGEHKVGEEIDGKRGDACVHFP